MAWVVHTCLRANRRIVAAGTDRVGVGGADFAATEPALGCMVQAVCRERVTAAFALGIPCRVRRHVEWVVRETDVIFEAWKSAARLEIRDMLLRNRWAGSAYL
jgi:tartrate dehydratase alpha subunit/fumarate hydratase class I-like protein